VKPLLYKTKKEIIEHANKYEVPFLDDESNERNLYLRNRYRHAIVPVMKQENENLLEQIKQFHLQVSQAFTFIRRQTTKQLNGSFNIDISMFKTLDEALKDDMIAYLIESHDLSPSYEIIMKIKRMLESKRPNQTYRLSKDYVMTKSYNNAFIEPLSRTKPIKIEIKNGINRIDNNTIFTFLSKTKANTENFTKLCYNKLAFPLWLRHREDGDVLSYTYGHKKLKKLLIDRKVPTNTRNALWVLVDHNQTILWVEDFYLNQTLGDENEILFELKRGQ
jgi:tRNA(Ile)-lysidine synthase